MQKKRKKEEKKDQSKKRKKVSALSFFACTVTPAHSLAVTWLFAGVA